MPLDTDQDRIAGIPGFRPYVPEDDIATLLSRYEQMLRSGDVTKGPWVEAFEAATAARMGDGFHAVAVANATIALEALYRSLDVRGHEVVVPANTFVATASAAVNCGADVRFVDIDPATLAPTPEQLDRAIGPRTKMVVLCHMGGLISPDTPALVDLCTRRGVICIEDSAQALGVRLKGVPAGAFGLAGVFSFFPGKVVTAGEGGMVVSRDEALVQTVRVLRDQGRDPDRVHRRPGFNWRMSEMQAALGETQMARLDEIIAIRAERAELYRSCLSDLPGVELPSPAAGVDANWYKYWITLPGPGAAEAVAEALQSDYGMRQAGPLQGHGESCAAMPAFAPHQECPVAEHFCRSHVGLPIYPGLQPDSVRDVARAVREILTRAIGREAGR
ncbi:DegT/DnrJ/EryC1/StrS family aminotransferase [Streptomyces sp. NPDC054770]